MYASTSSNSNLTQYEELVSGVNCPTCNGTGKVPRDSEKEYVALIPLSDNRLKPRRTGLWLCVTVTICVLLLVGTFCLLFFLLPRSIELSSNKPFVQPLRVDFNGLSEMQINLVNFVNLTNNNYFGISVTKVDMLTVYLDTTLCEASNSSTAVSVGPRSATQLSSSVSCRVDSPRSLIRYCAFPLENLIYLKFSFTVMSSYMFDHREEATLSVVQITNCTKTAAPSTTTPAPTSTTTSFKRKSPLKRQADQWRLR